MEDLGKYLGGGRTSGGRGRAAAFSWLAARRIFTLSILEEVLTLAFAACGGLGRLWAVRLGGVRRLGLEGADDREGSGIVRKLVLLRLRGRRRLLWEVVLREMVVPLLLKLLLLLED